MKIIDAYWEKRNLGVDCKEIVIEDTDKVEVLSEIKSILESVAYLVVKVPTQRFDIYKELTSFGFAYIESSINFRIKVKEAVLLPLQHRLNQVVSYAEMDSNDRKQLFAELDKGLFDTDRIALDTNFSGKQAATRYKNWITDDLSRGTQLYKITYKDDVIGFFTFKEIGAGIYYPFLAGLYEKYNTSGLGFSIIRKPTEEAIKRGGNVISTYVSSNNMSVVRTHLQQGFIIQDIKNVFVKHNNN